MSFVTSTLRRAVLAIATAGLAACGHVPLASIVKLSKFDALTTDPATLRLAVLYPDAIRVPDGGAEMHLKIIDKTNGAVLMLEDLAFASVNDKADKAELSKELREDWRLDIYKIPEENLAFFRGFQTSLRSMSEQKRKTIEGSMEISVEGCKAGKTVPKTIVISTFLKSSELGAFVPLLRDVDLTEAMGQAAASVKENGLKPCSESRPVSS